MKLFLDTAEVNQIRDRLDTGLIAGVTTNPTLIKKSGKTVDDVYDQLIHLDIPDISMEVVEDTADEMYNKGMELAEDYPMSATIKLPCSIEGLKACKLLNLESVRTNVTLVFSASQAILASLAGATYVSPFIGRMDDNSLDGLGLINDISKVFTAHNVETKILAASLRDVQSVTKAFELGAHICTVPVGVFDKMIQHVLTDKGIEQFNKDTRFKP
tara:strand:+ start:625 stop:1269 length:645 start_codon:yes stop_codon:yes gene_type:complete